MGKLLSEQDSNTKLSKNDMRTWSLSLAPADTSGHNVCPWSTPGCRSACVAFAGMAGVWASIMDARKRKTRMFFDDRAGFLTQLKRELANKDRWCKRAGVKGRVRLNTYSDIVWERMIDLKQYPNIGFYDYTKSIRRAWESLKCDSYRLIYSYNETSNPAEVRALLEAGGTVAMVRADIKYVNGDNMGAIPDSVEIDGVRFPTFDADATDDRYNDPKGAVGILRLKGNKQMRADAIRTGFAQGTPHPTNLTISAKR